MRRLLSRGEFVLSDQLPQPAAMASGSSGRRQAGLKPMMPLAACEGSTWIDGVPFCSAIQTSMPVHFEAALEREDEPGCRAPVRTSVRAVAEGAVAESSRFTRPSKRSWRACSSQRGSGEAPPGGPRWFPCPPCTAGRSRAGAVLPAVFYRSDSGGATICSQAMSRSSC